MKTFKYILTFLILVAVNSCLVDDTTSYDQNDKGYNLAGFKDPAPRFHLFLTGMNMISTFR